LIRLAVRAPAEHAEPVLAALLELAPTGVEHVDGEGFVEYAVYGAPGELPALPEGRAELAGIPVRVSGEEVPDDWAERWKRFHQPLLVAPRDRRARSGASGGPGPSPAGASSPRLWVRPPWADPHPDALDLVIDPAQAFGTGAHPTTRLSLELLLELDPRGTLADLGCGSGVLAIAAARLGFAPVTAVDSDRAAIEATWANARANGVKLDRVERVNLRERPGPGAATVTANLTRPLLLRVAELMPARPRALIVSGLLDGEADEVAAAFEPLIERRRLSSRGWSALLLTAR
jgi:ribosomal protein L11 methyltransferase